MSQLHPKFITQHMRVFVTAENVPIGYSTPSFPSLWWPLGPSRANFQGAYLYYLRDVWRFTVFWCMILFLTAYTLTGLCSAGNMIFKRFRENKAVARHGGLFGWRPLFVGVVYIALGAGQGFISGAVVGLLLLAIYKAGALAMSTWIPFSWGFALIFYHICLSYSTSLLLI